MDLERWEPIEDTKVRHLWVSREGCDETCYVSPSFYAESGTPIDSYGEDMMYSRTEILR